MSWLTEYQNSLKMKEVEEVFDLFFYRPLGFVLVKLIYPTSITPNQITCAAIVMGVIAGGLYARGEAAFYAYGALFYLAFNVLDCSDGQLARLKRNGTPTGRIIDGVADYVASTSVFLGIGIGYAPHTPSPALTWLWLVLTGGSSVVLSILVDYYRNRFLDRVLRREDTSGKELEEFRKEYVRIRETGGQAAQATILRLYLFYAGVQQKLTARKTTSPEHPSSPQQYYDQNKTLIRFWVMLGPTTQITACILFSVLNRFDLLIWTTLAGFNSVALVLWLIQRRVDER